MDGPEWVEGVVGEGLERGEEGGSKGIRIAGGPERKEVSQELVDDGDGVISVKGKRDSSKTTLRET